MASEPTDLTSDFGLSQLKRFYNPDRVRDLTPQNLPFWGLVDKETDWSGTPWHLSIQDGRNQGGGADLGTAIDNIRPGSHAHFNIPFARQYQLAEVDYATVLAARNGDGSMIVDALQNNVDNAIAQFFLETERGVMNHRTTVGSRGVVAAGGVDISGAPTYVITLDVRADHLNFERKMVLTFDSAANSTFEVDSVDRRQGEITVTRITGSGVPAAADEIFRQGEEGNGIASLGLYLPDQTGGALPGTLYGMNRDLDPVRRAGVFHDANAATQSTEDAIYYMAAECVLQGVPKLDLILTSPLRYAALVSEIESTGKVQYDKVKSQDGHLGFDAIMFHTPMGTLPVVADPWCPDNVGYGLNMSTWVFRSLLTWGQFLDRGRGAGGVEAPERVDSLRFHFAGYGNLGCRAPGWNSRIKFQPLA